MFERWQFSSLCGARMEPRACVIQTGIHPPGVEYGEVRGICLDQAYPKISSVSLGQQDQGIIMEKVKHTGGITHYMG